MLEKIRWMWATIHSWADSPVFWMAMVSWAILGVVWLLLVTFPEHKSQVEAKTRRIKE
jgi:hypothetical protein